jgi:hypothetical protein
MTVVSNNSNHNGQLAADVLLVAVTAVEVKALMATFDKSPAEARRYIGDKTYYDFGEVGGAHTILVSVRDGY